MEKRTVGDGLLATPTSALPTPPALHQHGTSTDVDNRPPRFHRLEFPRFDGTEDPLGWIQRCDQFFRGQKTPESEKVWLASYHLTGVAQQWYFQVERDEGEPNWKKIKEYVNLRF